MFKSRHIPTSKIVSYKQVNKKISYLCLLKYNFEHLNESTKEIFAAIILEEYNKFYKSLNEEMGRQVDVINCVNFILPKVIDYINRDVKSIPDEFCPSLSIPFMNFTLGDGNYIKQLNVCCSFYNHEKIGRNIVQGRFKASETNQEMSDGKVSYNISIELNVYNWDLIYNLSSKIKSVLIHELHHAYNDVVRFNKKSITKILNSVNQGLKFYVNHNFGTNRAIKEFVAMFYINIAEERNAKIHELYMEAQQYKNRNYDVNQIIEKLSKFTPMREFYKLKEYSEDDLSYIPIEIKQKFVQMFNVFINKENGKLESDLKLTTEEMNYPKDPEKFFIFWQKQFQKNAVKSMTKILKIARLYSKEGVLSDKEDLFEMYLSEKNGILKNRFANLLFGNNTFN